MHANHRTLRTSITALTMLIGVGLSGPERAAADVLCGQVVRVARGSMDLAYDWVKLDFVPPIAVTPDQEYAFRIVGAPAASCYGTLDGLE